MGNGDRLQHPSQTPTSSPLYILWLELDKTFSGQQTMIAKLKITWNVDVAKSDKEQVLSSFQWYKA